MTEEADLCIICYSELDCSGSATYSLPECGHTFHQNCIMHWFRQANSKCPLCNNTGSFNGHPNVHFVIIQDLLMDTQMIKERVGIIHLNAIKFCVGYQKRKMLPKTL